MMSKLQRLFGWSGHAPLVGLDGRSRALAFAVGVSVALHGTALFIRFGFPEPRRPALNQLDVVLVNSKTRSAPVAPDVQAQANLDGGGNTDQRRRARTPLPVLSATERGEDLAQATRKVHELETQQRQLLSQLQAAEKVPAHDPRSEDRPAPAPRRSGVELASSALMFVQQEAQIARNVDEYNQRPRKHFVGVRATEARFALYVEHWRQKIERIGSLNYPEGARGKIYGSLRLEVSIRADGSVVGIDLLEPSGYKVLDAAAERIVRLGEPYAKFPPEVLKDTDVLVITRTWHFAPGDRVFSD